MNPHTPEPAVDPFGHFAARFYDAPVPGQIGPQERHYVLRTKSLAAAKRAAKALQQERGHIRLVEVFAIPEDERAAFRRTGWYVNECRPNPA